MRGTAFSADCAIDLSRNAVEVSRPPLPTWFRSLDLCFSRYTGDLDPVGVHTTSFPQQSLLQVRQPGSQRGDFLCNFQRSASTAPSFGRGRACLTRDKRPHVYAMQSGATANGEAKFRAEIYMRFPF